MPELHQAPQTDLLSQNTILSFLEGKDLEEGREHGVLLGSALFSESLNNSVIKGEFNFRRSS